jgi:hypothetical protein
MASTRDASKPSARRLAATHGPGWPALLETRLEGVPEAGWECIPGTSYSPLEQKRYKGIVDPFV